jgi:Ca2+-binding EF-hand superfamily protein
MRTYLLIAAVLLGALSAVAAPALCAEPMNAAATMILVDRNRDGRIDREEYHQRMTEVFYFADLDKDGKVTHAELTTVTVVDPEAFKNADRDGDGKHSVYEFLYIVHRDFDVADKNQDGVLDMQELIVLIGR